MYVYMLHFLLARSTYEQSSYVLCHIPRFSSFSNPVAVTVVARSAVFPPSWASWDLTIDYG